MPKGMPTRPSPPERRKPVLKGASDATSSFLLQAVIRALRTFPQLCGGKVLS